MSAHGTSNTSPPRGRGRSRGRRQTPRPAENLPAMNHNLAILRAMPSVSPASGDVKSHAGGYRHHKPHRHKKVEGRKDKPSIRREQGHEHKADLSARSDAARGGLVYISRASRQVYDSRGSSHCRAESHYNEAHHKADDWCSDDEGDFCPFDDYVDFMKRRLGLPEPVDRNPPRPEILDMAVSEIACPPRKQAEHVTCCQPALKSVRMSAFQRLAGEIRQKIYDIICDRFRVEVQYARRYDMDRPRNAISYRLCHRQLWPRDETPQTTASRTLSAPAWFPPLPWGLIFSCRSIYHETLLLLYSRTQFVFNSSNAIKRFLETTSSDAQSVIRHVEINQIMYSEPSLTRFRHWKELSDHTFIRISHAMAEALTSLRILHVNYRIRDWPIRLTLDERWAIPLHFFCATYGGQMEYVSVTLDNPRIQPEKLKEIATELERRMMKPEAFQIREDARLAREMSGPVRAAKVLRIVL